MATQLALQRNFVTIKPTSQSGQTTQAAIITSTSATTNGGTEIVTIKTGLNATTTSEANTVPILNMQPVQQASQLEYNRKEILI